MSPAHSARPVKRPAAKQTRRPTLAAVPAPQELADEVKHYAQCRSLGHEWQHKGVVTDKAAPIGLFGAAGFRSVCPGCGTERIKWLGRNGSLGTLTYNHPDDYTQTGEERLDRQGWRRALIVTVFGDQ